MTDTEPEPVSLERVTVNLIPQASDALRSAQTRDRISKTDIINRALTLYDFIGSHTAAGDEIVLVSPGGKRQVVRFL